jgi:DNA-directed RNA polymerase specialized sigma24 family protein
MNLEDAQPVGRSEVRRNFNTTHWTVVLAAQTHASPTAQAALEELCRTYWYPIYVFVRRQGRLPSDAQDLTQAFFAHLLRQDFLKNVERDKGRFRSFLLACLRHFLADEWDRGHAEKRCPSQPLIALDASRAEERYHLEPAEAHDPESLYARRWALTLIDDVLSRLQLEFGATGQSGLYGRLQDLLVDGEGPAYAELAAQASTTEAAIKMTVYRMRRRFRDLFREAIAQTVNEPEEIEEEMRYLMNCLRS